MKRIIAILLTLIMLFSVASCQSNKKTDAEKLVDDFNKELDDLNDALDDAIDDLDDVLEDDDDDTVSEFVIGEENGDVYTNKFSGLKFTKPSSWTFASEEEKLALHDSAAEIMDMTDFEKKAAELATVYDTIAMDATGGHSVQVIYENLTLSNAADISEQDYIDIVVNGMKEEAPYDVTVSNTKTVELSDDDYKCVEMDISSNGKTAKQVIFIKKIGNYMSCVMATSPSMSVEDFVEMFD